MNVELAIGEQALVRLRRIERSTLNIECGCRFAPLFYKIETPKVCLN